MAEQEKKQEGQLNIELDEKIAEGTYANLAIINHWATDGFSGAAVAELSPHL